MTLRIPTAITCILASLMATASPDPVNPFRVSSGNSILAFKANKDFLGGTVKLFSASGRLLAMRPLKKRKVKIDFSTAQFGQYKVVVSHGNKKEEYYYMKK